MLEVHTGPRGQPPFACEVTVREEDRGLVLSAANVALDLPATRADVAADLEHHALQPLPRTGSIVRHGPRWFAVVHDLDRLPTTGEDIILAALTNLVRTVDDHDVRSLAIDAIGSVHGPLTESWSTRAITSVLTTSRSLERLWIVTA